MADELTRLIREVSKVKDQVRGLLSADQIRHSSIENGTLLVNDENQTPVMTIGLQDDGTTTIKHVKGPKPPAPSAPTVTPDLSTLLVAWDGRFTGPRPEDWDRVDVHVSQEQAFTPSADTLRGSIVSQDGGDLTLRVTGGTWHVRLVAVSRAEMHSDPSEPSTAKVEGITDRVKADIEASEGRLTEAQQKALEELAELDRKLAGVGEKAEEATLSARNAHNVAVTAQSAADDALAKYGPLDQRTIDAQKAAKAAQAKAEEAYSTAEGVSGDVAKAKADADAAKQEALAAKSSASQAQSRADQARNAATQAQSAADDALAKYGPLDQRTVDAQARAEQAKSEAERAHLEALASKSLADAAKKRADDAYALAQSKLSAAEVDKRILQSANGKNTITVSTSVPGSESGIAGDLWRRVDANGHVFAEWMHDGKAWKPALIRSDMITNLDVHKLTVSGSARVEDAVIEKLWVDGLSARTVTTSRLTVSPGNIYRDPNLLDKELWGSMYQSGGGRYGGPSIVVESGNRQRGTYDLKDIPTGWSATDRTRVRGGGSYRVGAWVRTSDPATDRGVALYVCQYTETGSQTGPIIGPLEAGSVSQGVWTWFENDITVRDDAAYIAVGCLLNIGYEGSARFSDLSVVPKVGAVLIEDGAVTAPKITASQELTAKIAQFLTVRAGQIEADAIDGMTITGAIVQTSHSHPKSLMDTAGFHVTDADGSDQITLGHTGGDLLSISDSESIPVATVSDIGEISGAALNIDSDPVFSGIPLLGQSDRLAPTSREAPGSWFDSLPRGVVSYGRVTDIEKNYTIKSAGGEMALMELQADLYKDRAYRVTVNPIGIRSTWMNWWEARVRYTWDGSRPTFTSRLLRRWSADHITGVEVDARTSLGGSFVYSPGVDESTRFLITIASGKWATVDDYGVNGCEVVIEDIGLDVENTGVRRTDNNSKSVASDPPPPAPPPPPQPKNYTKKYWANGGRTFYTKGGWRSQNRDKCYQGSMPGVGGVQSIATFPSMTGDLSGATITAMTAYVYMEHFYYGSGGQVKLIGHNRLSSDISNMPDGWKLLKTSNRIGRNSGVQIPIPRECWNDFKTGNLKGIGLGDSSPTTGEYGYGPWKRMWIEVKYRK